MRSNVEALLFDLDGTFADTAPDLAAALNALRAEEGLDPVAPTILRPYTSQGVRGMLHAGWSMAPDHPRYRELYLRFLTHYGKNLCRDTVIFPGIADTLTDCAAQGIPWGIVTNKTQAFTLPLLAALDVPARCDCVVSGDSSPRPKPDPRPLLLAASLCGAAPARCVYVGDDQRDIVAGKAAGMTTVAVRYGYLAPEHPIESWGADLIVDHPRDLKTLVSVPR
jgi:phosphoglycolate phosphatase